MPVAEPWEAPLLLLFGPLALLMALVLRLYFRRIRVRMLGPFPARGAVLVVSNHPCTWVDAGVLDLALRRRLHFLTDDVLFRPRSRALFLRIYGSLPLSVRDSDPQRERLNATTFRRCEALFDRGAAVAMFPEGVSCTDRGLLPLHPGAARLALQYHWRGGAPPLAIIPVSLHYSNRAALQSEVTVTVGPVLRLDEPASAVGAAIATDAALLTARIGAALRAGIADLDRCGGAAAAALEAPASHGGSPLSVETCQALANALAAMAQEAPQVHRQLLRRGRAYSRMRRALRASDRAFAAGDRTRAWPAAVMALSLVPGLIGLAFHAVPLLFIERATRDHAPEASRVALVRITGAAILLPLWYAAVGFAASWAGVPARVLGSCLLAAAACGIVACGVTETARGWMERARLAWIARRHPRLVARARALRIALQHDLDHLVSGGHR